MSQQEESALSALIRKAGNARGHWLVKNHGNAFTKRGVSDISGGSRDSRPVWLETKLPGKERSGLSKEQFTFLRHAAERCPLAVVSVVASVADAIWALEGKGIFACVEEGFVSMRPLADLPEDQRDRVLWALQVRSI